jgi:hypothetical protein
VRSVWVQASPSSQGVFAGRGGYEQVPFTQVPEECPESGGTEQSFGMSETNCPEEQ